MNEYLVSALKRKARRDKARDDIEYFAEYYLHHFLENEVPIFHKEMRKLFFTEKRLAIAAPRGFAKSTNLQIVYALHCLLFNENEDILTVSQSAGMAEDWIRKIKFELEGNTKIREDFKSLLEWGESESKRWTADDIVIQKDGRIFSRIRARGRGCQVRGLRPTKVFCDDLEDDEEVRSDEQRRIIKDWFLSALINTLKYDQQLIVIGTVLHPLALLAEILKQTEEFGDWIVKKYVALQPDGTSLWENRFPAETLLKKKIEIGSRLFEQEFQNNPIASDTCLWDPNWIKKYDKLPEIKSKFVALDPAATEKESADYSALCCMGVGVDNKIYEIETIRGHWGTWELIDKCINFYIKHKPIRFGIEEVAFQSFIRPVLTRKAEEKGVRLPVERLTLGRYTGKEKEVKDPRDKYTRALSVIHFWEQGAVLLKSQDLIDEISLFPTGSHDDMVDACVWAIKMIMKHTPIAVVLEKPKRKVEGFVIKDNTMPAIVPPEEFFETQKDWKLGV